jgi:hypothetical protein
LGGLPERVSEGYDMAYASLSLVGWNERNEFQHWGFAVFTPPYGTFQSN